MRGLLSPEGTAAILALSLVLVIAAVAMDPCSAPSLSTTTAHSDIKAALTSARTAQEGKGRERRGAGGEQKSVSRHTENNK